jgi:ABC-type polysaccharide/polyol phosphate export permease
MQALFYGSAIIYPVAIVVEKMGDSVAKVLMMNPITQSIQGARYALIDHSNPTLYSMTDNILLNVAPIMLVVVVAVAGGWMFKKKSPYFAEEV